MVNCPSAAVQSNLPFFHPSIAELILEKMKIQKTIEEQILLPPYMTIFRPDCINGM
jgi:hypothetical protein